MMAVRAKVFINSSPLFLYKPKMNIHVSACEKWVLLKKKCAFVFETTPFEKT
jgi:hypothetical protein